MITPKKYTTALRDNFPGFAYWGDLILSEFQISFALAQHIQENNATQDRCIHQDACIVAGWILHSNNNDNNTLYINIIDNFYVIVNARIR